MLCGPLGLGAEPSCATGELCRRVGGPCGLGLLDHRQYIVAPVWYVQYTWIVVIITTGHKHGKLGT
jgi:hypothetical protein